MDGLFRLGDLDLPEALRRMKTETHRFIRHQYNWFRLTDERITWFDIENDVTEEASRLVAGFLQKD